MNEVPQFIIVTTASVLTLLKPPIPEPPKAAEVGREASRTGDTRQDRRHGYVINVNVVCVSAKSAREKTPHLCNFFKLGWRVARTLSQDT